MRFVRAGLLVSMLMVATACPAVDYPEGPMGVHLKAIVESLSDPSPERIAALVAGHMADELQALPMEAHTGYFTDMSADLGEFELGTITATSPQTFYVDLHRAQGEPMRLLIEFDPNPPHGLLGAQPIPFLDMQRLDIGRPAELRGALAELAADNRFSGALYIEDQGKVRFKDAFGMSNKRYAVANTVDTRFAIGSITKMFTRLAALLLVEDGKLDVHQPVRKWVPELPDSMASITPWHLLRHESGLTDYWHQPEYENSKHRLRDVADYVPIIASLELDFQPGTASRYSNAGFVLLGIVIQRASGVSYHEFVRQRVLAPAGMIDSDFEDLTRVGKPYAVGYTNLSPLGPDTGFLRENTGLLPAMGTPAGTSYSTLDDLLRFDDALWSDKVFSEQTRRRFFAVEQAESWEAASAAPFPPAFSAAGGQPGENSVIISVPGKGRRVVVLSNYDERMAEDVAMHLYRQLKAADDS